MELVLVLPGLDGGDKIPLEERGGGTAVVGRSKVTGE